MHGKVAERRRLWIRLDQDPNEFHSGRLAAFLDALGDRVNVDPSHLNVVDVRSGCVIIVIETSADVADRLLRHLQPSAFPDDSNDSITREWRVEAVRIDEPEQLGRFSFHRATKTLASWPHLSDLHVAATSEDQDTWMAGVERDVPRLLGERDLVPDVVIVSGDIANSGQQSEYEVALAFLERVSKCLPNPDVRWVFSPGNHDVCWTQINSERDIELRTSMQGIRSETELKHLISEEDCWKYLAERQANYRVFTEQANAELGAPIATLSPAAPTTVIAGKLNLGIASLNSALLSTRKDLLAEEGSSAESILPDLDLQHLAVGQRALQMAFKEVENSQVRIAVMHHPPLSEWFHAADQQPQRTFLGLFDFIHRGHEHMPSQTRRQLAGVDDDVFEVASGALHVTDKWYRGFCAVSLDDSLEYITTHYFTHGLRSDRWISDVETAGGGQVVTRIPRRLAARLSTT